MGSNRKDGALMRLTDDEHPRYVGIDYGSGDMTTECECRILPDGSLEVIDIRETPTGKVRPNGL